MKMKKLLALALAVVMAVSMLTACGGGGGTVSVDRGEVEDILAEAGYGPKFAVAVADATTADGVPCYLSIAVVL